MRITKFRGQMQGATSHNSCFTIYRPTGPKLDDAAKESDFRTLWRWALKHAGWMFALVDHRDQIVSFVRGNALVENQMVHFRFRVLSAPAKQNGQHDEGLNGGWALKISDAPGLEMTLVSCMMQVDSATEQIDSATEQSYCSNFSWHVLRRSQFSGGALLEQSCHLGRPLETRTYVATAVGQSNSPGGVALKHYLTRITSEALVSR